MTTEVTIRASSHKVKVVTKSKINDTDSEDETKILDIGEQETIYVHSHRSISTIEEVSDG